MKIVLQKENVTNAIKALKGIASTRGVQPVLTGILFETISNDRIKLCATDLTLSVNCNVKAEVLNEGRAVIPAKMIEEIISKMPDKKDISIETDDETREVKIWAGQTKFQIAGLKAEEFPNTFELKKQDLEKEEFKFEILTKDLNRAIKQTTFSALQGEVTSILAGLSVTINDNTLEMVATDGNRLTRCRVPINSEEKNVSVVISNRTLSEISKLISLLPDKTVKFTIRGTKILFEFEELLFGSCLVVGNYPRYQQLIPESNEKVAILNRESLINAIDRMSVLASDRTSLMEFHFTKDGLELRTDGADAGSAKEIVDMNYDCEDILIAFNYKYVLDALRCIPTEEVRVEMATNLSATLIKPELADDKEKGDYISLVMPVQVPRKAAQ